MPNKFNGYFVSVAVVRAGDITKLDRDRPLTDRKLSVNDDGEKSHSTRYLKSPVSVKITMTSESCRSSANSDITIWYGCFMISEASWCLSGRQFVKHEVYYSVSALFSLCLGHIWGQRVAEVRLPGETYRKRGRESELKPQPRGMCGAMLLPTAPSDTPSVKHGSWLLMIYWTIGLCFNEEDISDNTPPRGTNS